MSLSTETIDFIFTRLQNIYGGEWERLLGSTPIAEAKSTWMYQLSSLNSETGRERIRWALHNPPERAPNVIQFKNLCFQLQIDEPLAIENQKKADPAIVAKVMEGMKASPKIPRTDHKQWARTILASPEGRCMAAVNMAKQALGLV